MAYLTPADVGVSDDYQAHLNRNSREPGTDYMTPYGTPIRAAESGTVIEVDNSNQGAEGRRVSILLHNGEVIDYIHLSKIYVRVGKGVSRGEFFAESGASGFGRDWHYGPHVHVTRRARRGLPYRNSIDFEPTTKTSGGNTASTDKGDDMIVNIQGKAGERRGGAFYISNGKAVFIAGNVPGAPTLDFRQGSELAKHVSGIR